VMAEIVRLMLDLGWRRDETARWSSEFGRVRVEVEQSRLELAQFIEQRLISSG
jgi:hypothetical protein